MQRTVRILVVLLLAATSTTLVLVSPASAEHLRDCDRGADGECKVGIKGVAGLRCLIEVLLSGGITLEVNPFTKQFRGGTDGPDNEVSVNPTEVYCAFGGDDSTSFPEAGGTLYGGPGQDFVLLNEGTFRGGPGDDWVDSNQGLYFGGRGDDRAVENQGVFFGGPGHDMITLPQFSSGTCFEVEEGCVP